MSTGSLRFKARASERAQPISAHLELTYRCNWRCTFCFNPRHQDRRGLSEAEWLGVLDELRRAGTMNVSLTGGEPLLHPGFLSIARGVRERYLALRVFTNGSLLDEVLAREIAALAPLAVELSLHGGRAATHDAATLRPGSFDALLRGVRLLRDAGARVLLKSPLTRESAPEVDEMVSLAAALGVPYQVDVNITPRDDGDLSPLAHALPREEIVRLFGRPELARFLAPVFRSEGDANCGLGRITAAIDPEGNVYPCPQWRHSSIGNVREVPFSEMWRGSSVRAEAAVVAVEANDRLMRMGEALSSFSFCPARALQTSGDLYVPDTATRERAEAAAAARARAS